MATQADEIELQEKQDAGAEADKIEKEPEENENNPGKVSTAVNKGGMAVLNDEIEILSGSRIEELDQGPSQAYAARYKDKSVQGNYYAVICDKTLVPRARIGPAFANIINTSLVRLVASGKLYWPPLDAERYCFVFENRLGKPLTNSDKEKGLGLNQETVMNAVIRPLTGVLQDLRDADIAHGGIRPANIYDGGKSPIERVLLGECLSVPPSYCQPVVFEPIERALCDPVARGFPRFEDDMYAFGVTIAVLMRGHDPLEGMTDDEIISQKMQLGSYAAITGKDRFTGPILELLRGLVCDDRSQRWTIDDLTSWLDGQRLSPKQNVKKIKAARPMHFNNKRYFQPSLLAMDLNKNQAEAMQLIDGGNLEQWIDRSLEDGLSLTRFFSAMDSSQEFGRGTGYWDRVIGRVMIALDPSFPIVTKGHKMHPEGIPYALAKAFADKTDLLPFQDIIMQKTVMFWLNCQHDGRVDYGTLMNKFDGCRSFLRQNTVGYGIERCLYFLNPEAPCLSENLKDYYIRNPEDFMYALEDLSSKKKRPDMFLDRHSVAFLSVKERQVVDPYLIELNSQDLYIKILGNIKCLATIQKRSKMESFPGIARWIDDMLGPVYDRYHDRDLRKKIQERVQKLADSGDLIKIAGVLDNPETVRRDFIAFKKAMKNYHDLNEEYLMLEKRLDKPEKFGKKIGHEASAVFSSILASIFILGYVLFYFFKGAPF
jgi:serine/threonine protein kinase